MFATKTPPASFGQNNKSRAAVGVSGGKAAAAETVSVVGGMAIKKNETFVRRLSASTEQQQQQKKPNQQSAATPRPEPVKLQQESFQPAAAETAPRKVKRT